ncbi:MAG: hypothetical protein H3C31_11285 [Brumimicrobium sp.]|nr:hypothetical protein [Brumimicrobium sp.]
MKKIILAFIFIFVFNVIKAQVEVRPVVGLSEQFSMPNIITEAFFYEKVGTTDFRLTTYEQVGVNISHENIEYNIIGLYGFGVILPGGRYIDQELGMRLGFRFNKNKKFGFLLSLDVKSQVASNYHLKYMDDNYHNLFLSETPGSWMSLSSGSHGSLPGHFVYHSNFYVGTPFVGNILMGVDYRIMGGLHINVSAGFGVRIMKAKYAEWIEGQNVYEKLEKKLVRTHYISTMDFELGVSYAIPVKSGG